MKCPKCQYLGFDGQTRCRHCGYDLSLVATPEAGTSATSRGADADVDSPGEPMTELHYRPESSARAQARAAIQKRQASRTPTPSEPFDLPLFATPGVDDRPALPASRPPLSVRRAANDAPRSRAAAAAAFAPAPAPAIGLEPGPPAGAGPTPDPADLLAPPADAPTHIEAEPSHFDMNLRFDEDAPAAGAADDAHLAGGTLALPGREASSSIGVLRAPDAVIPPHAYTKLSRTRADADTGADASAPVPGAGAVAPSVEHAELETGEEPAVVLAPRERAIDPAVAPPAEPEVDDGLAPVGRRMLAGLVDLALLAVVDAAVVFATLRATGLELSAVDRLPVAPLAVFLLLLAMGYFTMCTVLAGRTFGKSLFGLAVVEHGGRPVRLAPAVVRAAIQVVTVPAAGIGFLPALVGADRRALYDRLAGTDVIRDPAFRFPGSS
jgi:uncharacterized RDD family membrane protein YckC